MWYQASQLVSDASVKAFYLHYGQPTLIKVTSEFLMMNIKHFYFLSDNLSDKYLFSRMVLGHLLVII